MARGVPDAGESGQIGDSPEVVQPFTTRTAGNSSPNGSTPANMFEFSSDFSHAGGLASIEFRISGSGTGRTVLSVDDFSVTCTVTPAVPEPASLALPRLGLAALGLHRRV